jgi:hypothetical protein
VAEQLAGEVVAVSVADDVRPSGGDAVQEVDVLGGGLLAADEAAQELRPHVPGDRHPLGLLARLLRPGFARGGLLRGDVAIAEVAGVAVAFGVAADVHRSRAAVVLRVDVDRVPVGLAVLLDGQGRAVLVAELAQLGFAAAVGEVLGPLDERVALVGEPLPQRRRLGGALALLPFLSDRVAEVAAAQDAGESLGVVGELVELGGVVEADLPGCQCLTGAVGQVGYQTRRHLVLATPPSHFLITMCAGRPRTE